MIIAGATGTRVHPMKLVHSVIQEEVAAAGVDPARASRPFDLNRGGMVLGEGAGAVVLEELQSAQARGARIYAEVLATASSSVGAINGVARREAALTNALAATLAGAGRDVADVGHLNAHGLATRSCDEEESRAIHAVFGDRASRLPVTAAKSYFGNLGAGGGLVETVASVLSLHHKRLFPVLNYQTPDPKCDLAVNRDGADPGQSFLKLNVTPQGQASALLIGAFQG